jgi:hypothetical protein
MAHNLHAHRHRYPEFLNVQTEQGLRASGIITVVLLIVTILFVGFSLVEVTGSLPRP